jgi:uncharacterized membrane protein
MTRLDPTGQTRSRIQSIDTVRGFIMIIMTLDHTRDFLMVSGPPPLDIKTTTVILFFTRWITHFCAPTFVLLTGVSAYLAGQKRSRKQLSLFLLKRGLWLILSDLLIISLLFTFDPGYHLMVLEVLTAIGAGMIILSALIYAPTPVIAAMGLVILFGHNLLDNVVISPGTTTGSLFTLLFSAKGSVFPIFFNRTIVQLYALLPWSAPLFIGYAFGTLYTGTFDAERRRKILLRAGIAFCLLFIVLRFINHYGDQNPWQQQQDGKYTFLSFLNASKQPPSLSYFSMTLGPILILLALTERSQNFFGSICKTYGTAPYFYFIVHLCTIRLINVLLVAAQGIPFKFTGYPLVWQAEGFGYPLWAIYLFWMAIVAILYLPCKWYGQYKKTHSNWWLSYI